MKLPQRMLIVLLPVALLGATVPRLIGQATAGPLTGTITVEMHETYSAPGVTSSTSCSATLILSADGTTSAEESYTHDRRQTELLQQGGTIVFTEHDEPQQGGSFSNVTRPEIGIDPSTGTYTVHFDLPQVPLKSTITSQATGGPPNTQVILYAVDWCPAAHWGFIERSSPTAWVRGELTGKAQLHGTVQAHGDFDESGGNGTVTVTWSLDDPSLATPAEPTALTGHIVTEQVVTATPTPAAPVAIVLQGQVKVAESVASTSADGGATQRFDERCTATYTLNPDRTLSATATYFGQQQTRASAAGGGTDDTVVTDTGSTTGQPDGTYTFQLHADGTYAVDFPRVVLPVTETRIDTLTGGGQPRTTIHTSTSQAACGDTPTQQLSGKIAANGIPDCLHNGTGTSGLVADGILGAPAGQGVVCPPTGMAPLRGSVERSVHGNNNKTIGKVVASWVLRLVKAILARLSGPTPTYTATATATDTATATGTATPTSTATETATATATATTEGDPCARPRVLCFSLGARPSIALPVIAANILRWQHDPNPAKRQPDVLTYLGAGNPPTDRNRYAACSPARQRTIGLPKAGLSCDEYPFASTYEGGKASSIAAVPNVEWNRENSKQGGLLSKFYGKAFGYVGGRSAKFRVLIVP